MGANPLGEFSFRSRADAIRRFKNETFDVLIVGGGITGAATARDAASRGLKVALIEKNDFAYGTSSRSSKLIHGGLRYLENYEFSLVFEALSERTLLLKTVPHMVSPLPFYFPIYQGDPHGPGLMGAGMWLYDLLAMFRAPGFHKRLSKKNMEKSCPSLNTEGLRMAYRYYDAMMWDDALVIEILRSTQRMGAAVANYVEGVAPIWKDDTIVGFRAKDGAEGSDAKDFEIRAHSVIICAGPWTDEIGQMTTPNWKPWLAPSKGVHLVFDAKRFSVPGAFVMSHRRDGRIAFVIPRPDFGPGVVIVGTTDGPVSEKGNHPEWVEVKKDDVDYLMDLLSHYFPSLNLTYDDIVSAYVGVRPLMGAQASTAGSEGQKDAQSLQKVSREHFIGSGPGGTVFVAGGKYTTHRTMAEEIVDFTLKQWSERAKQGRKAPIPSPLGRSNTKLPPNPLTTHSEIARARQKVSESGDGEKVSEPLLHRYGAEVLDLIELDRVSSSTISSSKTSETDPEGFPLLAAQLRFAIRQGMVIHLKDFYLRRVPLYLARNDHGLPWAHSLARVWAEENSLGEDAAKAEYELLKTEFTRRSVWRERLVDHAPTQPMPIKNQNDRDKSQARHKSDPQT